MVSYLKRMSADLPDVPGSDGAANKLALLQRVGLGEQIGDRLFVGLWLGELKSSMKPSPPKSPLFPPTCRRGFCGLPNALLRPDCKA